MRVIKVKDFCYLALSKPKVKTFKSNNCMFLASLFATCTHTSNAYNMCLKPENSKTDVFTN